MGRWFESNILQRISVLESFAFLRSIWDDGVQGWRTGLKNRGRPFDSGSSHQLLRSSTLCTRCMVTYDVILPGWFRCGITDEYLGFYALSTSQQRKAYKFHKRIVSGMKILFHIFLKHMEQKTISMRSFLHQPQGCFFIS